MTDSNNKIRDAFLKAIAQSIMRDPFYGFQVLKWMTNARPDQLKVTDQKTWNEVVDLRINNDLDKWGFELPPYAPTKYSNLTVEEIYRIEMEMRDELSKKK